MLNRNTINRYLAFTTGMILLILLVLSVSWLSGGLSGGQQAPSLGEKVVQHHLNTMADSRTWRARPVQLGDPLDQPNLQVADKRRQYFFGRYWQTHVNNRTPNSGICDRECTTAALYGFEDDPGFEDDLRNVFPRLMAGLIASENPIDRSDAVGKWWWELPEPYAALECLEWDVECFETRRQTMRDDVNGWIRDSGLWVFADAGTGNKIDEGTCL